MRTVYKNGTVYTGNGFVTDFAVENTLPEGFKAVKRYVRFVWEDETE